MDRSICPLVGCIRRPATRAGGIQIDEDFDWKRATPKGRIQAKNDLLKLVRGKAGCDTGAEKISISASLTAIRISDRVNRFSEFLIGHRSLHLVDDRSANGVGRVITRRKVLAV